MRDKRSVISSAETTSSKTRAHTYGSLVESIGTLFAEARGRAAVGINAILVDTYWKTGRDIVEYEQEGSDRARYGTGLLKRLSHDLGLRFGRGFSHSNLVYMRKFYIAFRKGQTSDFLTWSHYLEILRSDEPLEIEFYCKACAQEKWTVRELRRQMESMLFHRIALSKDKNGIMALARKGTEIQKPEDIVKDPFVVEFCGIRTPRPVRERTLERALLAHLREFMLELGKGFSFVGSQYRIPLNTKHPCAVDLVFYNFLLKCFVLIDLKRGTVEHGDIGQMNLYLNYFKEEVGAEGDNDPVGIVLGADKDDLVVRYATEGISNRLFVSRYQLYLPDADSLRAQISTVLASPRGTARKRLSAPALLQSPTPSQS